MSAQQTDPRCVVRQVAAVGSVDIEVASVAGALHDWQDAVSRCAADVGLVVVFFGSGTGDVVTVVDMEH